jgi:hypothetical protein
MIFLSQFGFWNIILFICHSFIVLVVLGFELTALFLLGWCFTTYASQGMLPDLRVLCS